MQDQPKGSTRPTLRGQMAALYASHFVKYLLPLITIPYLARVLGVRTLGLLAFIQAFSMLIHQLLEFGFGLSMTKDVARYRDSPEKLARLTSGVVGTQVILLVVAVLVTFAAQHTVPLLRQNPLLLWMGLAVAITQGLNFFWFLRGVEKMQQVASLDVLTRLLRTVGIFLLVRNPDDVWLVLASDAVAGAISAAVGAVIVYRTVPFRLPSGSEIRATVEESWSLFVVRASATMFSAGNTFVLGLFVSPTLVGYFTSAEKISTAVRMLFTPAFDALYPYMSYDVSKAPQEAFRLMRKAFLQLEALALLASIGVFIFAPLIVRILFGAEFEAAVPILRIFAFFPVIVVANNCLGSHWLLILGYRKIFVSVGVVIGLLNVGLTTLVAVEWPQHGHYGAVIAFMLTQLMATVAFALFARKVGFTPHPGKARD
ncbi:MAG: oligosaccharide flippase family protein [Acidobacteriota bacterium]